MIRRIYNESMPKTLSINLNLDMYLTKKISDITTTAISLVITIALLMFAVPSFGQSGVACNDLVQISVNEDCEVVVLVDMIIENQAYPDSAYAVEVFELDGTLLPSDTIGNDYIKDSLYVEITHIASELSCWGYVYLEDKIAPLFDSCVGGILPPDTIACRFYPDNIDSQLMIPTATDNCDISPDISYSDVVTSEICGANGFSHVITRTWIATDECGTEGTCVQTIYVERATLDDVIFPGDYDGSDFPVIDCDDNSFTYLENGCPSPESTGYPTGLECANMKATYNDIIFDLCGAGMKCYRQWYVLDWCTAQEFSGAQTLKIEDTNPPIVTGNIDTLIYFTSPGSCYGNIDTVPAPNVINECSDWTYTIAYKLRDESGAPLVDAITDNVIDHGNGHYGIHSLPSDTVWISYVITDDCGYNSVATTEVRIVDHEPPSAICERYTAVSLDITRSTYIFAASFDDHSHDNCSIDRFEVKRLHTYCSDPDDLEFGEKVEFCCEDLDRGYIQVVMRVYDHEGFYSDCIVNVTVQDKDPIQTTYCPPNITVHCTQDYSDPMDTGGYPVYTSTCPRTLVHYDNGGANECGSGRVVRSWYLKTGTDSTRICSQIITVRDTNIFNINSIHFPRDTTIVGCSEVDVPVDLTGKPLMLMSECSNIVAGHEDEMFYGVEGVCQKIIRTWTVIDWCNFNSNNPDDYIWRYAQKILLIDNIEPEFKVCQDIVVNGASSSCEGFVELIQTAVDDCTQANDLTYRWEIDLHFDNGLGFVRDQTGYGNDASGRYPVGVHKVTFYVEDQCGNESECCYKFTIKDSSAPSPVCITEVSLSLNEYGEVEIWASDFDASSTDGCSGGDLIFSFSENRNDRFRTFTCDDLSNGVFGEVPLEMWVTDQDGNQAYCTVRVYLQDNKNVCPDEPGFRASIGGSILNEELVPLRNVEVSLYDAGTTGELSYMTDDLGSYSFGELSYLNNYMVKPQSEDNVLEGISTLDIVLIQQHVLGTREFNTAYKKIAADVNKSGSISALDIVEIRKLILGLRDDFSNSEAWRFVDASYDMTNMNNPEDYPEEMAIELVGEDYMTADFIAVKVGDVSGNARYGDFNDEIDNRTDQTTVWYYLPQMNEENMVTSVNIIASEKTIITGFQTDWKINTVGQIQNGLIQINSDDWTSTDTGVRLSYAPLNPPTVVDGDVLFSFVFEEAIKKEALTLKLNEVNFRNEIYDINLESMKIELREKEELITSDSFVLFQNKPNPFSEKTTVEFYVPKAADVIFTVFDIQGRVVKKLDRHYLAGSQKIELTKNELKTNGLLYYQIESADFKESKRMIIMD